MNYKGRDKEQHKCLGCGELFGFRGYSDYHKYCSNKCQGKHSSELTYQKKHKLFLEGMCKQRSWIYKFLVNRDGDMCAVCNITEWNKKPIRLWVDHIDGNATNNQPDNFRLICPNCDSQSETFGAKNKGNGRRSHGLKPYG